MSIGDVLSRRSMQVKKRPTQVPNGERSTCINNEGVIVSYKN